MNKQPPSKKKYDKTYMKNNCVRFVLLLNKNTDGDIIDYLQSVENKNAYIKKLIRDDM